MMMALTLSLAAVAPLDCSTASSQPDLNECALEDYRRADDALNRQWRTTLEVVRGWDRDALPSANGSTFESRLRTAQRTWLAFRDAECNSRFYAELGTELAHTMYIHCQTEMMEERTIQLADLARSEPL